MVTWKYLVESFVLLLQKWKAENLFNIWQTKNYKNHLKMEFLSWVKKKLQTDEKYNTTRVEVRFHRFVHDENSILEKKKKKKDETVSFRK